MFLLKILVAVSLLGQGLAAPVNSFSQNAQSLFDYTMSISDPRFDSSYKYFSYNDNGRWSIRFTSWYTVGLLRRNQGSDLENAKGALRAILGVQMNYNYTSEWYGDFKLSPDEPNPTPNSALYPPSVYGTYDPNWRDFVGSQLVQIVAEYEDLLGSDLVTEIVTALEYDAVGAMRRNGSFPTGDNLILAYSNPNLMRTLTVGWVGARTNNQTFIDFANKMGTELYELFSRNGANTLGEYNAPTYYGMDIYALAANIKYGPKSFTMTKHATYMLTELWKDIADHYNPYLGNMVGPYDRAYSRDGTSHSAIIGLWFWALFGYDSAPVPNKMEADLLYDAIQGASYAHLASTLSNCISSSIKSRLTASVVPTRQLSKTIYYNLTSNLTRQATSWVSKDLMIGGQKVAETTNRGGQFTPAIAHWATDPKHTPYPLIGFISLYPTASTLTAVASANKLSITYPDTTQAGTDSFQFLITGIPPAWNLAGNVVDGFSNLPCLKVNVSAPGLTQLPTTYGSMLSDHYVYNVTYAVTSEVSGNPTINLDLQYTC